MTDAWTDRLVEGLELPAERLVFPVSRLVVDVERFPDDRDEPMAAKGMGAVYTRLSTGGELRPGDADDRRRLMERWYHPHHRALAACVDAALAGHDRCLIVDVHSFPSRPLPYEQDRRLDRPEICVGIDPWHSPFAEEDRPLAVAARLGFASERNRPFAGSIVPTKHWRRDRRVRSMMIEVRRDLYMDEATGEPRTDFARFADRLCRLIESLAAPE